MYKMENRSLALRYVSEAVQLDSSGFQQAAFSKYLMSLQILTLYLNELFNSMGFQKVLQKHREINQVLSMIHECSDRVSVIINNGGKLIFPSQLVQKHEEANISIPEPSNITPPSSSKFPAFEKMQNENMLLFKNYQKRLERAVDKNAKTNMRLEFERRLAENAVVAKAKYDLAVKKLQRERMQMMESAIRKLFENHEHLNEKEKEKQELYIAVLQYAKTETWPCTWKLNCYEMPMADAAKKVFQKTVRCSEHPLSQWLMVVQTNIKRELETILKHYSEYKVLLPDFSSSYELSSFKELPNKLVIRLNEIGEDTSVPLNRLLSLQRILAASSVEITTVIGNALEIFYLIYNSLLPDDSESICYKLMESYLLEPIWPNLISLFRISNLSSEYKISEIMLNQKDSDPSKSGFLCNITINLEMVHELITLLQSLPKYRSLTEKSKVLVQVSQKICDRNSMNGENPQRKLGADELIPLLCYVIIQSMLPQLASEVQALEQLFDMKYMLGEEGYALSSFMTALKYIEITKMNENENVAEAGH